MLVRKEKAKEATALELYVNGGKTFSSLVQALEAHVIKEGSTSTALELKELLKKLCLSAQGSRFAIHLEQEEITKYFQFLMVATEKDVSASALLKALTCSGADFQVHFSEDIVSFLKLAKRVAPKLVTHIQKSRNPDSQVEVYVKNETTVELGTLSGGTHTRSVTVTDAQIVGQRWFWEATAWINGLHEQTISLIAKNPHLDWFWKGSSFSELSLPTERFPSQVGALSHQLLFESDNGGYVSLTPLTSVAGLSQLAASDAADGAWKKLRPAEYGGTNARNIAAFMMDRSGQIRHPINAPWIPPRKELDLKNLHLKRPESLVSKPRLQETVITSLFSEHLLSATNENRRQRLMNVLEPLLLRACEALIMAREIQIESNDSTEESIDHHIFFKWIYSNQPLRKSELEELAEAILSRMIGDLKSRDFARWSELNNLTKDWVALL
jgi:hypothetical protein